MLYLNQYDYKHITYNHNVANGGMPKERSTVASSGCGLCSVCMVVGHLTGKTLSVEECVRLSEESGANLGIGTDMRFLGPVAARLYGLEYRETSDLSDMLEHLKSGGEAIEILIGSQNDSLGLFSRRRHYITLVSFDGREVGILDPSYTKGKYDVEGRRGRVRVEYPFVFCSPEELDREADKNVPVFYLFKKS